MTLRFKTIADLPPWHRRRLAAVVDANISRVRKIVQAHKQKFNYEARLVQDLVLGGLPAPRTQYRWHPDRKFRADISYPDVRLLIEIDGAAHRIKGRFHDDILKSQEAVLQGWTLLRIATSQVRDGSAVWIVSGALQWLQENRWKRVQ